MLNINARKFVMALKNNPEQHDSLIYKEELANKKVLVLDENNRNKDWVERIKNVRYVLVNTDHSFSDKRLELIEIVSDWLNN